MWRFMPLAVMAISLTGSLYQARAQDNPNAAQTERSWKKLVAPVCR